MIAIVCGDRKWQDERAIYDVLKGLKDEHELGLLVISGEATGADTIARLCAKQLGIDFVGCPANWDGRSFSAGPIRNALMLKIATSMGGSSDVQVHAFHRFIQNSKGTKDMVSRAKNHGVKAIIHAGAVAHA